MSGNDTTVGIIFKADGKDLVGELRLTKKQVEALKKATEQQGKSATKTAKENKKLGAEYKKTTKEGSGLRGMVDKTTQGFNSGLKSVLNYKGGLAAVSAIALASVISFAGVEKSVAEISTLVDTSVVSVDSLTDSVRSMAVEYGGNVTGEAEALYQIISSGAEAGAEANAILAQSNELAIGGVTGLKTAADGLTTVMNAYGDEADTVTGISDTFFVAMAHGKTTVGELASSIGGVAPLAAQLGIEFDEVAIAAATLTKGGVKTSVAMTSLEGIMKAVLKPTKEAADLAADLGLEFNAQALEAKGLKGFLDSVAIATDGDKESMARLFGEVEGLKGVMALTGKQSEDFAEGLAKIETKAEATEIALAKVQDTLDWEWDQLQANIKETGIAFGSFLAPAIKEVTIAANDAFAGLNLFMRSFEEGDAGLIAQITREIEAHQTALANYKDTSRFSLTSLFDNTDEIEEQERAIARLETQLYDLTGAVAYINNEFVGVPIALEQVETAIYGVLDAFGGAGPQIAEFSAWEDAAGKSTDNLKSKVETLEEAMVRLGFGLTDISADTAKMNQAVDTGIISWDAYADKQFEAAGFTDDLSDSTDDATKSLDSYKKSVIGAQRESDSLADKAFILDELFMDGVISAGIYEQELDKLGLGMGSLADDTDTAVSEMGEIWDNFIENTQRAFGDLIYGGFKELLDDGEDAFEAFGDTLVDMAIRTAAEIVSAWATAGIADLFSGKGLSGFSIGGDGGGFTSIVSGAKSAYGAITKLATAYKGYTAATQTATLGTANMTAGVGTGAATIESLGAEALAAKSALAEGAVGLEAFGGAGAELGSSSAAAGAGMATMAVGAGVLVVAMVAASRHSKIMAETQEEIKAKFAEANNVIHTGALTWGEWGDQGLVALNSVSGGAAQDFRDTMNAIDVSIRSGGDGMFLLGNNVERARFLVENYSEASNGAMQLYIDGQKQVLGLLEGEGEDRGAILEIQRQATAEWEASLNLINSIDFDPLVAEFSRLTGVAAEDFRAISDDGFITAKELATKFGWSAGEIEKALAGAAAVSVTEFLKLQGIAAGTAGGIKSGFDNAASGMSGAMVAGVGTIQSAINSLEGTSVTSTHDIYIKEHRSSEGGGDAGFATGTPAGGFIVPDNYPNDSFMIGVTSLERVTVETEAQQRTAGNRGSSALGSGKSDDRVVPLLTTLVAQSARIESGIGSVGQSVDKNTTVTDDGQNAYLRHVQGLDS